MVAFIGGEMNFPNVAALGLEVHSCITPKHNVNTWEFVRASDLEALLAKGVRVWSAGNTPEWTSVQKCHGTGNYTHTALLVGITEIKRETAEDVLRDLMTYSEIS